MFSGKTLLQPYNGFVWIIYCHPGSKEAWMNIVTEIKRYFRPLTIHPWSAAWRLRDHGFRVALSAWVIDLIEIGDHGRGV